MILDNIISILKSADRIAILPHLSVDGDGLGSSLALGLILGKLGKKTAVFLEENIPSVYDFLPGLELVAADPPAGCTFDVAVALDTGDPGRLGRRADIFNAAGITVNIDHHTTNSQFAFYNYVDIKASSVGEIVYQLIKMMGQDMDADIATCLYVALATDTGGFKYSNTSALTHQVAADLINSGVNVADVSQRVFDATSLEKTRLVGLAINSLELLEHGKVAFVTLTDKMVKETGAGEEDFDGIVNIGRNINGVEVAAMFREKDCCEVRVNLRSNVFVDVSAIARTFSGGGHKKASGCTVQGSLEEVKSKLLEAIRQALAEFNK